MKAIKVSFIIILLLFFSSCSHIIDLAWENDPYPVGRDTFYSFGNGEYQIFNGIDDNYKEIKSLGGYDEDVEFEENVYKFKDVKPFAYVVGSKGYTVLNYETGKIHQKKYLNKLSKKHQNVFLENEKFTLIKNK